MSNKHNWSFNVPGISGEQINKIIQCGIRIISIECISNYNEIELYLEGTFDQFQNARKDSELARLLAS